MKQIVYVCASNKTAAEMAIRRGEEFWNKIEDARQSLNIDPTWKLWMVEIEYTAERVI